MTCTHWGWCETTYLPFSRNVSKTEGKAVMSRNISNRDVSSPSVMLVVFMRNLQNEKWGQMKKSFSVTVQMRMLAAKVKTNIVSQTQWQAETPIERKTGKKKNMQKWIVARKHQCKMRCIVGSMKIGKCGHRTLQIDESWYWWIVFAPHQRYHFHNEPGGSANKYII